MKFTQLPGALPGEDNQNPALRQLVVEAVLSTCPILQHAEFYTVTGNADTPRKAVSATGGQVRALDDEYPENKQTPSYGAVSLVIYGDQVQTDIAHHRRGIDVGSVHTTNLIAYAKNFGKNLQYALVNSTDWNGWLKTGVIPAARVTSFSSDLSTAAKVKNLVMAIKSAMAGIVGGPQFVMMDAAVLEEITTTSWDFIKYSPGSFGAYVPAIDGVPIVLSGTNAAGVKTLPATSGVGTNATKIIVGRFGEKSEMTFATSVGLQLKHLGLVGTAYSTLVEMDIDFALLDDNAIAVIDEIQNP